MRQPVSSPPVDPSFAPAYNNLAVALIALGRFEEMLEAESENSPLNPDHTSPEFVEAMRAGYAEGGARGYWEAYLRWESAHIQDAGADAYYGMAVCCAQLGRVDEAFEHFERLVASRHPIALQIHEHPLWAPLRSDPRFTQIRRKIGLG